MTILFDEPTHTYRIDDRPAPGIHEILGLAGILKSMPDATAAMEFGKRVHTGVEHMLLGELYVPDYDDRELGCIYAAKFAIEELGLEKIKPELLVCNRKLWYATKVDASCVWDGEPAVINWKTGNHWPWYCLQTAAESLCFPKRRKRLDIFLRPNSTFNPVVHEDEEDYRIWIGLCDQVDWQFRKGLARLKAQPEEGEEIPMKAPPSDVFDAEPVGDQPDGPLF